MPMHAWNHISGAPYEQRVEWGRALYQCQVELGISIGGATLKQCTKWGKLESQLFLASYPKRNVQRIDRWVGNTVLGSNLLRSMLRK